MRFRVLLCCILMITTILAGCSGETEKEKETSVDSETETAISENETSEKDTETPSVTNTPTDVCAFCGSGDHAINLCPHLYGAK